MRRKGFLAIGILAGLIAGVRVEASVVVLPSKLFNGSGHFIRQQDPPPTTIDSAPTTYTEVPFPNDASNSITNNGTTLNVKADLSATHTIINGNIFRPSEGWTVKKFEIRFQLDAAGSYTINWGTAAFSGPDPIIMKLVSDDNAVNTTFNTWFTPVAARTGNLIAGTYTFSGLVGRETQMDPGTSGTFTFTHHLDNLTFDVTSVPEPGAVALLAACGVLLIRRFRF